MQHELKGKVKLGQHQMDKNDYWIYDDEGFICGNSGNDELKMKALIDKANNSIQLKNIDLTGISKGEQAQKVNEEMKEFFEAFQTYIYDNGGSKSHVIEEFWDEIQSKLGLLEKYGISASDVMKEYPKHLEKLKTRPRQKKCSKCIKYTESPNDENIFICLREPSEIKKDVDIAKECKNYKEQEE